MTLPTAYSDQIAYMQSIVDRLNVIEGENNVIQVVKTTEPQQLDFVAAWLAKGYTLPIKPGYEFHWFDGTILRGTYGAVDDGFFILSAGQSAPQYPAVSPVIGDEVYLYNDIFDMTSSGVVLANLSSNSKTRTKLVSGAGQMCFSPDAQNFAYVIFGSPNNIWTATRAGASPTQLTTLGGTYPHWRGTNIVFIGDRAPHAGTSEVYIMTQTGTGQTRLTTSTAGKIAKYPQLSPDGTKIAYISNQGGSTYTIWVMNSNGTGNTNLGIVADYVRWSPDGSKLYYSARRNIINNTNDNRSSFYYPGPRPVSELYSCTPAGANQTRITDYFGYGDPGESPVNFTHEYGQPYSSQKAFLSDVVTETLHSGFDVFPDDTRFLTMHRSSESYPIDNLLVQANQRGLAGSTGVVHRLISNDTPYGDIELLDSIEILTAGITSWRTNKMANRPELSHLLIVWAGKVVNASTSYERMYMTVNDDVTAANYRALEDVATATVQAQAEYLTNVGIPLYSVATTGVSAVSSGGGFAWMPDFNDAASLKQALHVGGAPWNYTNPSGYRTLGMGMGLWNNPAPITSLTFKSESNSAFQTGSIISVYGIVGTGKYSQL